MAISCSLTDQVSFEPLGSVTSIFFDDKSNQIFSVRSRGATGIIVKGFIDSLSSTFRLEDRGPIITIKLSPDQKILGVQRDKSSVEFFSVTQTGPNGVLDANSFSQGCKTKTSTILGFYWNTPTEVTYLTSHGIEIHNVIADRRQVKLVKNVNQLMAWFIFCPKTSILVASPSRTTSSLHPYVIKNSNVFKLPKFEVSTLSSDQSKIEVKEKDVQVLSLYDDQHYIAVIIHTTSGKCYSEVQLYSVNRDAATVSRTHVLRTPFNGSQGLALHAVDDVLLVHHRKAAETWFFDIGLGGESDGSVLHHKHIGFSAQVADPNRASTTTTTTTPPASDNSSNSRRPEAQTEYPTHWVMFAPDVVIDANVGMMWHLALKLKALPSENNGGVPTAELSRLVGFLLQRQGAKLVLLDTLLDWCCHPKTDLGTIGNCFARINREYRLYIDQQLAPSLALPASSSPFSSASASSAIAACPKPSKVILDQADIYTNLLSPLLEKATVDGTVTLKRVSAITIEYVRSLEERQIPAQHFLHELIINLFVRGGQWYQLHQLLQYHIISDSKPLACLLLSLEAAYPSSFQLAVDMLARLKTSTEEIVEILLSKGKVLSALHFAAAHGLEAAVSGRKFLSAAKDTNDDEVFLTTYKWLSDRRLLQSRDKAEYREVHERIVSGVQPEPDPEQLDRDQPGVNSDREKSTMNSH